MELPWFIFEACWSQTDHDIYVVKANSKEEALRKLKETRQPHHWNYMGQVAVFVK